MNNSFSKNDNKKYIFLKEKILANNLASSFLISCNNINKLEIFTIKIIKFLLCLEKKEINCKCNICQRIDNKTYCDLIIKGDFKSIIKKEIIKEIIKTFSFSALEKKGIKIYIIKGIDLLTLESSNFLLKFLEESYKNTYAFLLTNNRNKVIDVIKLQCLNIILDNTIDYIKVSNFANNFICILFKNFVNNLENNFIHIIKLNNYNKFECYQFFLIIINFFKKKEWKKYKFINENLIKKLNCKNNKLIEICFNIANLFLENLNRELILEKWLIDLYYEIKN